MDNVVGGDALRLRTRQRWPRRDPWADPGRAGERSVAAGIGRYQPRRAARFAGHRVPASEAPWVLESPLQGQIGEPEPLPNGDDRVRLGVARHMGIDLWARGLGLTVG